MVLQCTVIDCDALMTDFSLVFLYDHCHFLDVTVETVDGILEDLFTDPDQRISELLRAHIIQLCYIFSTKSQSLPVR